MSDKNKKRQEVTDQAVLDQLNSDETPVIKPIVDQVDEGLTNAGLPVNKRGFVMDQLRHETGDEYLESPVAVKNNNVSGITWNEDFPADWKGSPRPASESGNYVHFPTYTDWAKEHIKLLHKDKGAGAPIDADTIEEYAHRLKKNGYYTASESEYLAGLKRMQQKYGHQPEEVTDPALLQQLEGTETTLQKKSPSETGSPDNTPISTTGSKEITGLTPTDPITGLPVMNQPAHDVTILKGPLPQTQPPTTITNPKATYDERDKTNAATSYLTNELATRIGSFPSYADNVKSTPFADPNSVMHKIADPHGDPAFTGGLMQSLIGDINQERKQRLTQAQQDFIGGDPNTSQQTITDIEKQYNKKIDEVRDATNHVVGLQLFNKEYTEKPLTDAEVNTKIETLNKQRADNIKNANDQMHQSLQGENKLDMDKADAQRIDRINQINKETDAQINTVTSQKKWDAVRLGIEQQRLTGDKQAEIDAKGYDNGGAINPAAKVQYQIAGNEIKKTGMANAAANDQQQVVDETKDKIQSPLQIERDNQQYYNTVRANKIGNAKYEDENPLFRAIVPHFGAMSEDDVRKYGKQVGLTNAQIAKIDPAQVPTSSTVWQQFAKGALNTPADIYERIVGRPLMKATGATPEEIDARFAPGWQNERGVGATIAGNMPTDQNSFKNVRGAIGQMFEGAGGLSTFVGEIGATAKGLEAAGMAKTAESAQHMANFGVMAFNGYNNAYNESKDLIGDKPKDEWKRQAYAITSGIIEGKIFTMIHGASPAELGERALGTEKGDRLLEEIRNSKSIEDLQTPTFKEAVAQNIMAVAAENGQQVGLATANTTAQDIIKSVVTPDKKQDIGEDLKNTAVSTSLVMMIPSILGGMSHGSMQTPLAKAAMFEVGTNSKPYIDNTAKLLSAGKITPEQAQTTHDAIITMGNVVKHTPTVNAEGKPLTPDQVKDYAWNLLQENTLQKQADKVTQEAEALSLTPDKAQLDPINKKIAEATKNREDILKKAGEVRPLAPSKPIKAPNAQGSVATDAKSAVQDYVTKIEKEGKDFGQEEGYKKHLDELKANPEAAIEKELTFYQRSLDREEAKEEPDQKEIDAIQAHIDQLTPILEKIKSEKGKEKNISEKEKEELTLASIGIKSTEQSQNKNTDHGTNRQDGEGKQENGSQESETTGRGRNTNVQGRTEDGRLQGQEEGLAEETTDKGQKAGATSEQPALAVSGKERRKRMKLVADEETLPPPRQVDEFRAMDHGTEEGNDDEKVKKLTEAAADDEKVGGGGESFNEFKERIQKAWENTKKAAKDKAALITHSSVMRLIQAAEEHGWDDTKALREAYNKTAEPKVGEEHKYAAANGEIRVMRHGESEDGKAGLDRTKETELTPKGEQEAKGIIAEKLKEEKPSEIITDTQPRTSNTADIVHKELSKKEFNPPQPTKPVHDMTGDELDAYHKELKQYNKDFEQSILGDNYKEFKSQQRVADNPMGLHSKEVEGAAEKRVKEIFDGLSKEDQDALEGVTDAGADPNKFYEPEDVVDIRNAVQIVEGAQDENELGRDLRKYFIDLNNAPEDFSKMNWRQKTAFSAMKAAKRIIQERGWNGRKVTSVGLEAAAAEFPDKNDAEFMLSKYIDFFKSKPQEQPKETPRLNGAIATTDVETEKVDASNRLKEIDEELLKQHASQKVSGQKRIAAEKAKDIAEANRHNDNWYKKQDRIDKLEEEKESIQKKLEREDRDNVIKKSYKKSADSIRELGNYLINDENIVGSFPIINPKNIKEFINHVADIVEKVGNLHVAIESALREYFETHPDQKQPTLEEKRQLEEELNYLRPEVRIEPFISRDNREFAESLVEDIKSGEITYDEAVHEIMESQYTNREGDPVSENVARTAKGKILNYIDWHEKEQAIHNASLATSEKKNIIGEYSMTQSDAMTRMLSGQTIERNYGEKPTTDQEAVKYDLALAAMDSQKMVSLMKSHFGTDITQWGKEMLNQIRKYIPGNQTEKRVSALLGLQDELFKDRSIYEYELSTLGESKRDIDRRAEVNRYLSEIPQLLKQVQKEYQVTQREASKTLNAGRNMAKLATGNYFKGIHADDAVLDPKQKEAKQEMEDAESKTNIPEKVSKEGVIRDEKTADKDIEQIQQEIVNPPKEKAKSAISKLKEIGGKKKVKDKMKADKMKSDAADNLAKKGMTPDNMFDKIKDLLKKIKC